MPASPCRRVSDLVVSGSCGEHFLAHLQPQSVSWAVTIDLSQMTFCQPAGLVGLAAFAQHAVRHGHRCRVLSPDSADVARYLSRMHVGEILDSLGVENTLMPVREHMLGDALLELRFFEGARGADNLAQLIYRTVEPAFGSVSAAVLHNGVAEAGQNVAQHSGQMQGFLAAQRTHQGRRLWFAVSDSGVGLRERLAAQGAGDDEHGIRLALKAGVSSIDDPGRGNGLSDMRQQLSSLGGYLQVVSGKANAVAGRQLRMRTGTRPFPGTIVQGEIAEALPAPQNGQ